MEPGGEEGLYLRDGLKRPSALELRWAWESLSASSCCRSVVVFHSGACVLHAGRRPVGSRVGKAKAGPICQDVMQQGRANYLANLKLFPGALVCPWCAVRLPMAQANLSCNQQNESPHAK